MQCVIEKEGRKEHSERAGQGDYYVLLTGSRGLPETLRRRREEQMPSHLIGCSINCAGSPPKAKSTTVMQRVGRKRQVNTCLPCRKSKQRCNRQYPCNHCTRRRKPEDCVYERTPAVLPSPPQLTVAPENKQAENSRICGEDVGFRHSVSPPMAADSQHSELARSFGYFEGSSTVALLRNLLVADRIDTKTGERADTSNIFETIRHDIERMPGRQILDFLVQYFVSELNWMKQLVHPPRFLIYYQGWWARNKELSVEDAEFAVLTLRICSYAAQFLPSPSHPGDEISGISLSEIRATCGEIGDSLLKSCLALDWEGSIFRVQHILFAALNSSCEGRTDRFWEGIASACRAAQKAGLHIDESCHRGNGNSNEFEKEMRRRTLCNLYLLDSHLSRQLDRVPFLPDDLVTDMLPRLRLKPDLVDLSIDQTAPELFTERLMQVQLGRFWRKVSSKRSSPYDPCVGEQCYEQLLSEYLPTIPPALSLNPDTQWDTQLPKLPMQRQLLYISIFDSICWNFKPLLLLTQPQIATLPPYKRVLIQSQKQRLASAALKELDAISALHSMFGGSRTRFAAIIFNSFEASVLLLTLGLQPDFPFDQEGEYHDDILKLKPTRCKVMQAVEKVLARLHMLAEVNEMAAAGARVASQLFARAMSMSASMTSAGNADLEVATTNSSNFVTNTSLPWPEPFSDALLLEGDTGQWATDDQSASGLMRDLLSTLGAGNAYPEPEPELQQWESGVNWS